MGFLDEVKNRFFFTLSDLKPSREYPLIIRATMYRTSRDVVLTLHPDTANDWRSVIPHDPDDPPEHIHIQSPPGSWHRSNPQIQHWADVGQRIQLVAEGLSARPGSMRRLDVIANSPYSLGLLLGASLELHAGQLTVWQYTGAWTPWPLNPPFSGERYFADLPDLSGRPSHSNAPVVLVIELSRAINNAVEEQLDALRLDNLQQLITLRASSPSSISMSAADVGPVVFEILSIINGLIARYLNAPIHLFYSGPLTPIIYLGQKLHLIPHPILCYDQVMRPSGLRYERILRFPERTLLPMAGTSKQQQLQQLLRSLFTNNEMLRFILAQFQDGEALRDYLPSAVVPSMQMMDAVVQLLGERRQIDAVLFDALCEEHPARSSDIRAVEDLWS